MTVLIGFGLVLAILAFAVIGVSNVINSCFASAKRAREEREDVRVLMRMNMNEILEQISTSSDPLEVEMLRQAYADSCGEYRKLCR